MVLRIRRKKDGLLKAYIVLLGGSNEKIKGSQGLA